MVTRIHRLTGVCLLTTGLVVSCMSGAIASADSKNDAKSDAGHKTSSSTSEGGGTSTTSSTSTAKTDTAVDDPATAAEPSLKSTGVSGSIAEKPTSTVSAQTNTSWDTVKTSDTSLPASPEPPHTVAAEPTAVSVVSEDPPATTGLQIPTPSVGEILANIDAKTESPAPSTVAPAASDTSDATKSSSDTAESAQPLASTSSATPSAEDTPTSAVGTTSAAAPAEASAAVPAEASAAVATPTFREAVVYLLRILASAKNFVDAILQLPAEFRAALGIPWITPGISGYHALMSTPNVALLNLLVASLSQAGSPSPGSALAVHRSGIEVDGGITLLTTQRRQPVPTALAAPAPPHRSVPTVIKDTVAAILVTLSLWSIFYAALPGLGGLISFGAAGVRIGYRQANAGIALQTPEMARFLRPGPIGVVRTGSLVSVHSRSTPAGHPTRRRHLKTVA